MNLVEKRDDIAIAHFEAYLEREGLPSNWVRELVTGARDSATGQAYLDRRIPQIVASIPEERAYDMQRVRDMWHWYRHFGFLDRYFELILPNLRIQRLGQARARERTELVEPNGR